MLAIPKSSCQPVRGKILCKPHATLCLKYHLTKKYVLVITYPWASESGYFYSVIMLQNILSVTFRKYSSKFKLLRKSVFLSHLPVLQFLYIFKND